MIAMVTRAAGVTVNEADAATEPELMPIDVVPAAIVVAKPCEPTELLMVATLAAVELQWPACVRSCVEPSVYAPVAVNCCGTPAGTLADGGLIAIETNCAAVTVSGVEPVIDPPVVDPEVALMLAAPTVTLTASPLFTVAADGLSDNHVAEAVKSCVLPSVKVPVAVNCWVVPSAIESACGVTAIDTSAAVVTVTTVVPLTVPDVALMLVVPVAAAVAKPCVFGALLIEATDGLSELHCTVEVRFCVL